MIKSALIKIILFFQLVFLLLPLSVSAQTPTVGPPPDIFANESSSNVPGLTCGSARNPSISKCCIPDAPKSIGEEVADNVPQFSCLIDSGDLIPGLPLLSMVDGIPVVGDIIGGIPLIGGFFGGEGGPAIRGLCISDLFKNLIKDYIDDTKAAKEINKIKSENPVDKCVYGDAIQGSGGSCQCVESVGSGALCKKYLSSGTTEYGSCESCSVKGGVWTAGGCFYTNPSLLISENILPWGLGVAGSLSLLCISYAAFILQTSRGNPERIKKAREYLRACITGLLLIIFSVFILQLIGVTILRIPGFN